MEKGVKILGEINISKRALALSVHIPPLGHQAGSSQDRSLGGRLYEARTAEEMAERGIRHVSQYDWNRMIERYVKVFRRVFEERQA